MKRILTTILLSALLMLPWAHTAFAADQTIAYTEEMVGSGHPTKADTLNRHGLVEHNTDGTHQKPISHLTASRGVVTDADKKLASDEAATGTGSPVRANTPTLVTPVIGAATGTSLAVTGDLKTNTTGTIDVAAGKTVNIDDDVTISAEFHVEAATHVNQDLTSDASPIFVTVKLSGLTDGYLPYHVNDATGLANSPIYTNGTLVGIGTTPVARLHVRASANIQQMTLGSSTGVGYALTSADGGAYGLYMGVYGGGTSWIQGGRTDSSTTAYNISLQASGGSVSIGTATFIDDEKLRVNGDIYSDGDVSALTFTDRTPYFDGDAIAALAAIQGKNGEIDHSTLPEFARKTVKKNIYTDVPLTEISSDDAFETVSVEQDKIVVDENGKKSRVISGTISSGYEVKDGQVIEKSTPVYEKETVKKTQLKKNIHFDSATGKLYRTTGGEVFEKDGILYERILSGQEDQERRDLGAMISILTVAIQQQQAQIELLKARVTALEKK